MTTWASFWSRSEQDLHLNYLLVKKPKRNKPPLVFYFIDQSSLLDFSGHLGLLQWLYEGHVTNGLYSCYPIPPHFVNFLEKFSIGDNLIQHQHNERTLYVFFFPSLVFFAITDWHLAIKWLNFIREKWNLLLGHLLSPCCFYIKLVGGKENGEVLAPPSWASWVDEIFSGQFGGYFASWMWAEKNGGTEREGWGTGRGAALSAQGSFTTHLVGKIWACTLGQELGLVVPFFSHFSETELSKSVLTSLCSPWGWRAGLTSFSQPRGGGTQRWHWPSLYKFSWPRILCFPLQNSFSFTSQYDPFGNLLLR